MADDLRQLILQARDGDRDAFEALYQRFGEHCYNLCWRLLDDPDEAADACQETFVKLLGNLGRLRQPEAFATWLRGAALQVCRHRRRKQRWLTYWTEAPGADRLSDRLPAETAEPSAAAVDSELSDRLRQALAKLSDNHREAVVLHYLEGLSVEEIAATLGVAPGTVKSRLARARDHLERLLTPYLSDGS